MSTTLLTHKTLKASTQSIRFENGMLVTAEDLATATNYPLDVIQILVRAYFGCGVVCGFKLAPDERAGKRVEGDGKCPPTNANYVLEIGYGVALDCHGFPIEMCGPFRINLEPDRCAPAGPITGDEKRRVHIAVRRSTEGAPTPHDCGCEQECGEHQCSRIRDHVVVGVFNYDDLPDNICRRPPANPPEPDDCGVDDKASRTKDKAPKDKLCDCLMECGRDCCGESWVLLGAVTLDAYGIIEVDVADRRYVKPIECKCAPEAKAVEPKPKPSGDEAVILQRKADERLTESEKKIGDLVRRLEKLERPARAAATKTTGRKVAAPSSGGGGGTG